MNTLPRILPVAVAALLCACSPYSPNLGDRPFRCGTDEPRCPDGYECVEVTPTDNFCERNAATGGADAGIDGAVLADARPFQCNDDSEIEPNDTTTQATTTPIPAISDSYSLVGLAICPDTDLDLFRFGVDVTGKNVQVDITYTSQQGQLVLNILNSVGTPIATGNQQTAALLRAELANAPAGTYFVSVGAAGPGIENNYNIDITTSGP